jgi:GNAT superfamily N-acetyltransferase
MPLHGKTRLMEIRRADHRDVHQLLALYVELRGEGIGSALLAAVEDWARGNEAEEMDLDHWVCEGDPGPFYERAGYRPISRSLVRPL